MGSLLFAAASNSAGLGLLGAAIGAGLAIIGGGVGIGLLAGQALAGSARQPKASGDLRTTMLIAAALIEGIALFALVICFLISGRAGAITDKETGAAGDQPKTGMVQTVPEKVATAQDN